MCGWCVFSVVFHRVSEVIVELSNVITLTKNIVIRNNIFIDSRTYAPLFPWQPVIGVQYCGDVILKGDDFLNGSLTRRSAYTIASRLRMILVFL